MAPSAGAKPPLPPPARPTRANRNDVPARPPFSGWREDPTNADTETPLHVPGRSCPSRAPSRMRDKWSGQRSFRSRTPPTPIRMVRVAGTPQSLQTRRGLSSNERRRRCGPPNAEWGTARGRPRPAPSTMVLLLAIYECCSVHSWPHQGGFFQGLSSGWVRRLGEMDRVWVVRSPHRDSNRTPSRVKFPASSL